MVVSLFALHGLAELRLTLRVGVLLAVRTMSDCVRVLACACERTRARERASERESELARERKRERERERERERMRLLAVRTEFVSERAYAHAKLQQTNKTDFCHLRSD